MIPTPSDPVATLGFFLIVFVAIGAFFLFIHLVAGSFVRPYKPDAEKLTIYECGEPTVGSAWVQFDLRYYVVALLFVIFDVEVAFFFPWATVFGKANQLSHLPPAISKEAMEKLSDAEKSDQQKIEADRVRLSTQLMPSGVSKETQLALRLLRKELKKDDQGKDVLEPKKDERGELVKDKQGAPVMTPVFVEKIAPIPPDVAKGWALVAFGDIFVFFGVLMVGFAYVWRRGDINWVRSYAHHEEPPSEPEKTLEQPAHMPPPAPVPVASHH